MSGHPHPGFPTRRGFTQALAGLACTCVSAGIGAGTVAGLASGLLSSCATPQAGALARLLFVGSDEGRVLALRFDAGTGQLSAAGDGATAPRLSKPRWLTPHPTQPVLYVAHEGAAKQGAVAAFTVDRGSATLKPLNEVGSGGAGPTHLWLDPEATTLLVSNFGAGSASSLALQADGRLIAPLSTRQAQGAGPHRRQASPHAHGAALDPSGRFALVADLGADRLFVYPFDRISGRLQPDDTTPPRTLALPPGSGPRHFVFAPGGRFVFLVNELTATLVVLAWDASAGRLSAPLQSHTLSPEGFSGVPSGSGLVLGTDGRTLYVAERGGHSLVVYRIEQQGASLTPLQRIGSGGEAPWAIVLHPSGRWLLAANQRSHALQVFAIEATSGRLAAHGPAFALAAPLCLAFA